MADSTLDNRVNFIGEVILLEAAGRNDLAEGLPPQPTPDSLVNLSLHLSLNLSLNLTLVNLILILVLNLSLKLSLNQIHHDDSYY